MTLNAHLREVERILIDRINTYKILRYQANSRLINFTRLQKAITEYRRKPNQNATSD